MSDIETPEENSVVETPEHGVIIEVWLHGMVIVGWSMGKRNESGKLMVARYKFGSGCLTMDVPIEEWRYPGEKEWRR